MHSTGTEKLLCRSPVTVGIRLDLLANAFSNQLRSEFACALLLPRILRQLSDIHAAVTILHQRILNIYKFDFHVIILPFFASVNSFFPTVSAKNTLYLT